MPDTMLVRIKPNSKREVHAAFGVTIRKKDGWCELPRATALKLREEPLSIVSQDGRRVFDVKEHDEAAEVEEAEKVKVAPAGTATAPKVIVPVEPSGGPEEAPAKKAGRGRSK
jgi:hypothetical protein